MNGLGSALSSRLKKLSVEDKRIARDMVVIMGFVTVAKGAAAAKEAVIAWRYGISQVVDAYLFVLTIVGLPIAIWFSVLSVVGIPLLTKLRTGSRDQEMRFKSELLGSSIGIGIMVAAAAWAALCVILMTSLAGLPKMVGAFALDSVPWLVLLIPVGIVTHYGSVILMSERRHANTLLEGVPAIVLLVVVAISFNGGLLPLLWGTVGGACLHLFAIAVLLRRSGDLVVPRLSWSSTAWGAWRMGVGVMLLAQVLLSLTTIIDQFFAARLGVGAISTLGYSNRILALLLTLAGTAVARATLPVFASIDATRSTRLYAMTRSWSYIMFTVGGAMLLVAWPLSDWAVKVLFERGAFTAADTAAVAEILRYSLLQLPWYFAALVISQALFSTGDYRVAAAMAGVNLLVKILASFAFVPILGLAGLMAATAVMYAVSCLILLWVLKKKELTGT